ncbi:MAG: MFS transporter [SAR324 cluster bacterium]|nr:MFS transporter [SAR324 cluster bacterium]
MPTFTNRWAVLALLFLARTTMAMQFQSIPPIAPFLIEEWTISYAQLGLLIGVFMLPGSFLALVGGLLGARFGSKAVMVTGLALMTAGAVLFASSLSFSQPFTIGLVGRLVAGVGGVLVNVQLAKMVTDWFSGKEIATAMSIQLSGFPFGMSIALGFLGGLALATSWQTAIQVTAGISALVCVLVLFLYRDVPARTGKEPVSDQSNHAPRFWALTRQELPLAISAGIIWMFFNVGVIVFISFAPLMLIEKNWTLAEAGIVISLGTWISIISAPLGGWLIDRTGKPDRVITAGILCSVLIIFLTPFGLLVPALVVLWGLARGLCPGGINALLSEVLRPESRSTGFGVYFTVYYLGLAMVPPMAGFLQDISGTAVAPVRFAGLITALTLVALIAFRILQRQAITKGKLEPETSS